MTDEIRPCSPGALFHLGMRAADADRERAVDVLRAGFAEGRLTKDEYDGRITAALTARTYGELGTLTRDLPAGPLPRVSRPLKTNNTAIRALKWGLFSLFQPTPVAIGLTLMYAYEARGQIRKTGEPGNKLALAALMIGYSLIAAIVVFIVLVVIFVPSSNPYGPN